MDKVNISDRLEQFRKQRELSKSDLARILNVDTGYMGNILRGKRGATLEQIITFLEIYSDVSAEWLLRGKGDMLISQQTINDYNHAVLNNTGTDIGHSGNSGLPESVVKALLEQIDRKDKQIADLMALMAKLR